MEKEVSYEQINLIGRELFRKNNDTFMRSPLSPIMSKIFIAANKDSNIDNAVNEFYMKSGILPNKIFYIYSNNLTEKSKSKLYDVVYFNGEVCIWFYSTNVINMIGEKPVETLIDIYYLLMEVFDNYNNIDRDYYIYKEQHIAMVAMIIYMLKFLHETYGILDMDKCKNDIYDTVLYKYTQDSAFEFIEDVLERCESKVYFKQREYLESYLLLQNHKVIEG